MTLISTIDDSFFLKNDPSAIFHAAAPPNTQLKVCVIVPVRNEAAHLYQTLAALYKQTDETGNALDKNSFEVLLLANNCTDNSFEIALNFRNHHPDFHLHTSEIFLRKKKANIGTVRRLLMDEAYRRLKQIGCANGIIASTDGDTIVDQQWVYHIIKEIEKGADAVGGRILTQASDVPVRLWHLRDVMYRSLLTRAEALIDPAEHDPWPKHFQYFGANLAVTCKAYEAAGRLPEVPFLEDNAFYEALTMIDARIRKSNLVKVYTSDRQQGRVEVGFSEQLKTWNELLINKKPQLVEMIHPQLQKWKYRRMLRNSYNSYLQTGILPQQELADIGNCFKFSVKWLMEEITEHRYFGQLWKSVEQRLNYHEQKTPLVPITQAIAELRLFVNSKKD